ncbi:MAG TPA: hypothetical protein VIY67_04705 [Nitrospiraceae bacterium]
MWNRLARVRDLVLVFLLLVSSLAACAGLGTQQQIPLAPVPITEVKTVEGTWEGLVINARTGKDAGRIVVVLTSHDAYGTYSFGGATAHGSLVGTGRVTVQSGRLSSETGQRMVDFTLCLRGDEKVLTAHVFGKDGNPYYAELTPMN